MTRGILLIANSVPLSAAIANEAHTRVEKIAQAYIPSNGASFEPTIAEETEVLHWNPSSAISARSVVLGAKNSLEHIDQAILVCSPQAVRKAPDQLSPREIDCFVDDMVKGWFFIARELSLYFKNRKSGTLALVVKDSQNDRDEEADVMGSAFSACFRSFSEALLARGRKEDYCTLGFSAPETAEDEAFAAYIMKRLDECGPRDKGKWQRFGSILPRNLFSRR